jgi:O-Antigen ligase
LVDYAAGTPRLQMRSVTNRRSDSSGTRIMRWVVTAGTLALVAWGSLAFGAVYPWAYAPLAAGCVVVGLAALWHARRMPLHAMGHVPLLVALALVGLGVAVQLTPLPASITDALSPARAPLLAQTDLRYAAHLLAADGGTRSQALSIDSAATWRGLWLLLSLAVLLAGLTAFFSREGITGLAPGLLILGLLVAVIGIVQKAVLGDHAWAGMRIYGFWEPLYKLTTPFGPYVNKNHFAGWMLMILPIGVYYCLAHLDRALRHTRRGWRHRVLWLSSPEGGRLQLVAAGVVIMAASLLMTRSRSGIAAFAVALVVAAAVTLRRYQGRGARAVVLAVLLAFAATPLLWADIDLASRFMPARDESLRLRREVWSDTLRIVRDFPLTGTGLNTFGAATLGYQTVRTDLHFREAHNDYLQIAAEGGLLLGVPAAAALVLLVWTVRQRFRERADDRTAHWLRLGAATGLLAIGLQSLVEFSLQMPGNAVLLVVLCAAAMHRAPGTIGGVPPEPDTVRRAPR